MKKIDASTKQIAIDLTSQSFISNPSMNWFLNKKLRKEIAMKSLCTYCIELAILKGGAFISSDLNCVCLIFKNSERISLFSELKLNYFFINKCAGWSNLLKTLKRIKMMKKIRGDGDYLHAFLLASNHKGGNNSVLEAKKFMFELSDKLQMPILAETCLPKNKKIYERFGFEVYQEWKIPNSNNLLWFLRKGFNQNFTLH